MTIRTLKSVTLHDLYSIWYDPEPLSLVSNCCKYFCRDQAFVATLRFAACYLCSAIDFFIALFAVRGIRRVRDLLLPGPRVPGGLKRRRQEVQEERTRRVSQIVYRDQGM